MADSTPPHDVGNAAGSQPNIYGEAPGAHSQPTISNTLRLPDSRPRRNITAGEEVESRFKIWPFGELPHESYHNVKQLRDAVFSLLVARLQRNHVTSPLLKPESFQWALPQRLADTKAWVSLLQRPFTTSPAQLRSLLNLTPVTSATPAPIGSTVFYVRSFIFSVEEFRHVLGLLLDESYDMNDKIFHWFELADQPGVNDNTTWTIRYCGMTDKSPWSRQQSDLLTAKKAKTWLGRFLKITQEEFPDIISGVEIDIVSNATVSTTITSEASNLREQLLITLFGIGVVNMQVGGTDVVTPFTQADQELFISLKSKTAPLFANLVPCPDGISESIQGYLDRVRKYVGKNPVSTGADKRDFSTALEGFLRQQATPAMLSIGCALVTTIASDIGQDDHPDSTFYRSGRRSAEIVNACFDHLDHWEKPYGSGYKPGATKSASDAGYLPFADVFPWFKKSADDFAKAGELLTEYLKTTKPLIALTYGQLPSYLALNSFNTLTPEWYYDTQRQTNVELGSDYFIRILGEPHQCHIGDSDENIIIIPCYHPGYLSQAGLPSVKATRLFLLVHQIVWFAMGVALQALQDVTKTWTRKELCGEIVLQAQHVLSSEHEFGRAFALAKKETIEITTAFVQGRSTRRQIRNLDKPKGKSTRSYSPKKSIRKERKVLRKSQIASTSGAAVTAVGPYEVSIKSMNMTDEQAPRNDRLRFVLSWSEPASDDASRTDHFTIGPIILPNGVWSSPTASVKRYIHYTGEGLDIRDSAGTSLGDRKPLVTAKSKNCTLPISMIVLHTSLDDEDDQRFLEHWEDVTGTDIDDYLRGATTSGSSRAPASGGRLPSAFFDASTKRPVPIPAAQYFHKNTLAAYASIIETNMVPANVGDFLWLFSQFFRHICGTETSISFDVGSGSETTSSVFRSMAQFCQLPKYHHHPYLRAFLALAHLPETGVAERNLASNVIVLVLQTLTEYTKKNKSMVIKYNGQKFTPSHGYYTFAGTSAFRDGMVADYEEPDLEDDFEILEETIVSDDDMDDKGGDVDAGQTSGKHRRNDSEPDSPPERKRSDKPARRKTVGGGQGEALPDVYGDDGEDDDMLF